jgi:hypothetical protein
MAGAAPAIAWLDGSPAPAKTRWKIRVTLSDRWYYLLSSFCGAFPAVGCGREYVDAGCTGFFAAFGFFASRFPRLRSLANVTLLHAKLDFWHAIDADG